MSGPAPLRAAIVACGVLGLLAAGTAWVVLQGKDPAPSAEGATAETPAALPDLGAVPEFSFTERTGTKVGLADLRGRTWVADFVFTSCAGTCPAMSLRMAEVHEVLRKEPDALCVTFTTDPERDTLQVLEGYAIKYGATPDRWLFVRGPQAEVLSLQHGGFKIGSATDPFLHSERFVLVDARGRIRGYYHALDPEGVPSLLRDFRRLRAEEGS